MSSVQMEQRVNLKFLVKLGKTFTETYAILKEVYGIERLSSTQVFEWFKRFKEGRETTEDDSHPGRPQHHRISIRGLAVIKGIDKECVRQILHELFNMPKIVVCAKMVPKLLTPKQKESRTNICADILINIDTDPGLLDTVITYNESVEAVKAKATQVLNQLTEADFQHCF
ncbi:hypothetical protein NQ318_019447 [Aromia moschata]|uniref:Mos1 transposase HTH domain-containing protein n=1 Tax=Aromia moschata TaxID=1265417 RepID=A0AAV8XKI6_9CUCU|nr:hypothetical protein NQ318_019447 [Aromia moschata]